MADVLFPPCEPTHVYQLPVGHGHTLYVEEMGNPQGIPVLNFHGGPGTGCNPNHRRRFDPAVYRIICFDQRGAGRSTPSGEIRHNTTTDLIADVERICTHLSIERFVAYGYSWGSTFALAYAQAHPERILAMMLGGILLGTQAELVWLMKKGGVAASFFPQEYAELMETLGFPADKAVFAKGYAAITGRNRKKAELAAKQWSLLDLRLCEPGLTRAEAETWLGAPGTFQRALLQKHYAAHDFFLKPNQLMRNMGKLKDIPVHIIQGQQDMLTPPAIALRVHQALPKSTLTLIANCGHGGNEAMEAARVAAGQNIAQQLASAK